MTKIIRANKKADNYRDQLCNKNQNQRNQTNQKNQRSKDPLLYHSHKIILKLLADGDLFIGDIDVVILYFVKLFGIDDIGIMHPHKGR